MERQKKENRKKLILPAVCLLLGIIFLFFSEYSNTNGGGTETDFDETAYTLDLETRLSAILSEMEGVSNVSVMITLESGEEYRYATQVSQGLSESSSFFLRDSQQDALLSTVNTPKIKGVSVVCKGANDSVLRMKITKLVSSTLNLSENQIYVTQ